MVHSSWEVELLLEVQRQLERLHFSSLVVLPVVQTSLASERIRFEMITSIQVKVNGTSSRAKTVNSWIAHVDLLAC